MVSAEWRLDAEWGTADDASWVLRHVALATLHATGDTALITYAGVRACLLRRTVADLEARTVLAALCSAASGCPGGRQEH